MATIESKIFQLLLAKSNAVDAYELVVKAYTLQRGTCGDSLFDKLRRSLSYNEISAAKDTYPFTQDDVMVGLEHLVKVHKIETVIVDNNIEYEYKRI